jgi:hypothetical protein
MNPRKTWTTASWAKAKVGGRKGGQAVTRDWLILNTMGWADFSIRELQ